jgi:hypothetical protein
MALAVAASVGLSACSSHRSEAALPAGSPSASVVPSTASPQPTSPLTGLPGAPSTVVVAKVDNVGDGAQTGLNSADVVYCELVEGGLTRLMAVFASQKPTKVGPVRSVRTSDIQLLAQYGHVALTYSGANAGVIAAVHAADIQDDSYDAHPALYGFDTSRPAPYQFLVDVAKTAAEAPGVVARDVGFRFGPAADASSLSEPSTPANTVTARYPATTVSATWDEGSRSWLISRDGRPQMLTDGTQASATNLLIQYVSISDSNYVDHNGSVTPISETVGSGQAVLFRDGLKYSGTWTRATANAPTTWTATGGASLDLRPGRTWVLLLPVGSSLVVG